VIIKVQDNSFTSSVQFQIETRQRIYFLRADTEEDVIGWVESIFRARKGILAPKIAMPFDSQTGDVSNRSGYLVKKGRTNKVWKKRWFVLSSNILVYYKTREGEEAAENLAGKIVLNQDCSVNVADESIKRRFCFILSTRFRNYFLQAADQYEMAAWIESIRFHCRSSEDPEKSGEKSEKGIELFNRLNGILASHDKTLPKP